MSREEPHQPLALGSVREALAKRGTVKLDHVAAAVAAALARLSAIHPWAFHLHLRHGADATAQVVSAAGAQREFLLLTHQQYPCLHRSPPGIEDTNLAVA